MRHVMLGLACLLACAGCNMFERGVPSAERNPAAAQKLKTAFSARDVLVNDRFLLLPVVLDSDKKEEFPMMVGLVSGASWSGFSSGSWGYERAVNLEVVDLVSGEHHRVFKNPVALGRLDLSFEHEQLGGSLHFPNFLILEARTTDADGDKEINSRDPIWVFTYDLQKHALRQVSPEGRDVVKCGRVGDALVMTTRKDPRDAAIAIYLYRPAAGEGRFVVQDLAP